MIGSSNLLKYGVCAAVAAGVACADARAAFVGFVVTAEQFTYPGVPGVFVRYTVAARFNGATDTLLNAFNLSAVSDPAALTGFWHKDNTTMPSFMGYGFNQDYGTWSPTLTGSATLNRPFDSYLTIGGQAAGTNTTTADPSWNTGGNTSAAGWNRPDLPNNGTLGWFNSSPPTLQGRVGNSPGLPTTDVRVGQFVLSANDTVNRTYQLQVGYNNGVSGSAVQFGTGTFRLCPGFTYYRDLDGDGFGSQSSGSVFDCTQPTGYVLNNLDCNDNDATLNPSTIWYRDLDGDGFGSSTNGTLAQCTQPTGYVRNNTDNCPSIANPGQEDCNGNTIGDVCELANGSVDCNSNGLVDSCEIAAGISPDCDSDGKPDDCEGAVFIASQSNLLPLTGAVFAEQTFTGLPRAYGAQPKITIEATADLGATNDGVIVTVDGGAGSVFFLTDGTDCPSTPNTAVLTYSLPAFNALVADGALTVRVTAFGAVNSTTCPNGGVRIKLKYTGLPASSDCNNNGLLDSCEIGTGAVPDCNNNGIPDSCDIASGSSADCNGNGKPDSCDIASGASSDINGNGRPDECSGEYVVGGTGYATILSAAMQAPLGSTILVAPGKRHEHVVIQRRVTVRSVAGPATTILDGTGLTDSVVTISDAAASGAVFDGFTIRNGISGTEWNLVSGGGLSIVGANATVRNCVFEGNHADFGGAIYMVQSASTIENCVFTNNSSTTSGGALGFEVANGWTVRNCTFTGNTSLGGGGAAYGTSVAGAFVSCTMSANQAAASGGGIAWDSTLGGSILLDTCSLEANSALAGGGLAVVSGTGAFDLSRSRLCRNTPDNIVGAVHDLGGNTIGTDCNHNGICDADELAAGTAFDCNGNGVLDSCDIASATSLDCNTNGVPDSCDIATGHSHDIDANGIPDECSPDCDADGRPDAWEIAQGFETDCNANLQPDRCDIAQNPALDCNHNGAIDSCEGAANPALDCNHNGVIDSCEIAQVPALDCNHNGRLDTCDLADNAGLDCDHNGRIDSCDIAGNPGLDKNANGHLDSCELARGDLNLDGVVNAADLGVLLNFWGFVNPPVGDLNHDGVVTGADLGLLLNAWGSTA